MQNWQGKRYWIVGASEGLGREVAKLINRAGAEVIVSARNEARLNELLGELSGSAKALPLDVTNLDSVKAAAKDIGHVDGVVYLAGVYTPIAAQDWDLDQVEAMGEVNYLGGARVIGSVIGQMVDRDEGHVVITGSLSGFRGLPGAIGYSASKAGIMSLAESMYADLRKTGVKVQVVNPGFIRTRLTDQNDFKMPQIMEPEAAAREVFEHMMTDSFKKSFPAPFAWLFRGGQFFPDWLWYRIFSK